MTAWFTEDPTALIVMGAIIEICLLAVLIRTGRLIWLAPLAIVPLVVVGLVLLERRIVTDRERVQETIYGAADAVKRNDVPAAQSFIASSAAPFKAQIKVLMNIYKIHEVEINDFDVTFNRLTSPPQGVATFFLRVDGAVGNGPPQNQPLGKVRVVLHLEGGRWLMADYQLQGLAGQGVREPPGG